MEYLELNRYLSKSAKKLYDDYLEEGNALYKAFPDQNAFEGFFLDSSRSEEDNPGKVTKVSLLGADGSAFASGCYVEGEERAYITMLIVERGKRRQGRGRAILEELEKRLSEAGQIKRTEIVFFNPMALSWEIPDGCGADHPNAPGADISQESYLFFKNCAYRDYAMQNSYYLPLKEYRMPPSLGEEEKRLAGEGITFELYDPVKHFGLEELMRGFHNSMWERDILAEAERGSGSRPLIIVSHCGKTVGFTGPLAVEQSGRGFFSGIGVGEEYRARGIATVLFCRLCAELCSMDAVFMTLFTGENNPARNIYEAAGFKIVRTWANMRKDLKQKDGRTE